MFLELSGKHEFGREAVANLFVAGERLDVVTEEDDRKLTNKKVIFIILV